MMNGECQCRLNANRGPWQLFAQAPLLTRDKDLSQPATLVDTTWWQLFRLAINMAHFYFLLQKLCQITWLLTGWKKILYFRRPPFGLRPVAFATSATCLIWHWWVYVFTCWSLCVECIACSFLCHGTGRLSRISVDMPFYYSFQCAIPSGM